MTGWIIASVVFAVLVVGGLILWTSHKDRRARRELRATEEAFQGSEAPYATVADNFRDPYFEISDEDRRAELASRAEVQRFRKVRDEQLAGRSVRKHDDETAPVPVFDPLQASRIDPQLTASWGGYTDGYGDSSRSTYDPPSTSSTTYSSPSDSGSSGSSDSGSSSSGGGGGCD